MDVKEDLYLANMATTPNSNLIAEMLRPRIFKLGDNVEKFIKEAYRFFKASKVPKDLQEIVIVKMIDPELEDRYEATEGKGKGFEERLKMITQKPADVFEDLEEFIQYRQGSKDNEVFFQEVDRLAEKLLSHSLTKDSLVAALLVNATNVRKAKKEVLKQKVQNPELIREIIREATVITNKTERLNTVKSYRDAVSQNNAGRQVKYEPYRKEAHHRQSPAFGRVGTMAAGRGPSNGYGSQYNQRQAYEHGTRGYDNRLVDIECWSCAQKGHMKWQCPNRKPPTCYACGTVGHIRIQCQKVRCGKCNMNGHKTMECRTVLNRDFKYQGFQGRRFNLNSLDDEVKSYAGSVEEQDMIAPNGQASPQGEVVGALELRNC